MKILIILMTGILLWITPGTSRAEENKELSGTGQGDDWMPPSRVYDISTIGRTIIYEGASMRCYTVEEGKNVLLPMFADYRALYEAARIWETTKAEYSAEISILESQVRLYKGHSSFHKAEAEYWLGVAKERTERLELSHKADWIPWALIIVESLTIGVVGVYSAVQ